MKFDTLKNALVAVMVAVATSASAANVWFDLGPGAMNANPASNRWVTLQALSPYPGNLVNYTSTIAGGFWASNLTTGDYAGEIKQRGNANAIRFQISLAESDSGTVYSTNVTSVIGVQSYPSTGRAAWSIQAADSRYAIKGTAGVGVAAGTNVTAVTNGDLVTISADATQMSDAEFAARAATNAAATASYTPFSGGTTNLVYSSNDPLIRGSDGKALDVSGNAAIDIPNRLLKASNGATAAGWNTNGLYSTNFVGNGSSLSNVQAATLSGSLTNWVQAQVSGGSLTEPVVKDIASTNRQIALDLTGMTPMDLNLFLTNTYRVAGLGQRISGLWLGDSTGDDSFYGMFDITKKLHPYGVERMSFNSIDQSDYILNSANDANPTALDLYWVAGGFYELNSGNTTVWAGPARGGYVTADTLRLMWKVSPTNTASVSVELSTDNSSWTPIATLTTTGTRALASTNLTFARAAYEVRFVVTGGTQFTYLWPQLLDSTSIAPRLMLANSPGGTLNDFLAMGTNNIRTLLTNTQPTFIVYQQTKSLYTYTNWPTVLALLRTYATNADVLMISPHWGEPSNEVVGVNYSLQQTDLGSGFARSNGLAYVDIYRGMNWYAVTNAQFMSDHIHWNALGKRWTADQVMNRIGWPSIVAQNAMRLVVNTNSANPTNFTAYSSFSMNDSANSGVNLLITNAGGVFNAAIFLGPGRTNANILGNDNLVMLNGGNVNGVQFAGTNKQDGFNGVHGQVYGDGGVAFWEVSPPEAGYTNPGAGKIKAVDFISRGNFIGNGNLVTNLNGTNIQSGTISTNKLTPEAYAALVGSGGSGATLSNVTETAYNVTIRSNLISSTVTNSGVVSSGSFITSGSSTFGGGLLLRSSGNINVCGWWEIVQGTSGGIGFGSGHKIRWGSGTTSSSVAGDIGVERNSAGVLEINNGTTGNLNATVKTGSGVFTNTAVATNGFSSDATVFTRMPTNAPADGQFIVAAGSAGHTKFADITTLGTISSSSSFTGNNVFTRIRRAQTDLNGGTALTVGQDYYDQLSGNRTLTFSGTANDGDVIGLALDVSAVATLTFPTSEQAGGNGSTVTTCLLWPGSHNLAWKRTGDGAGGSVWIFFGPGKLDNLNAATAPGTGDDAADGYSIGSVWIDTTADHSYLCVDATTSAAVWMQTDSGSQPDYTTQATRTNSLAVGWPAAYTLYTVTNTCALTNVTGATANKVLNGVMILTNSTASTYALYLPSTWASTDGTKTYYVTNGQGGQLSVQAVGTTRVICSYAPLY